jgi:hypothetical protein
MYVDFLRICRQDDDQKEATQNKSFHVLVFKPEAQGYEVKRFGRKKTADDRHYSMTIWTSVTANVRRRRGIHEDL